MTDLFKTTRVGQVIVFPRGQLTAKDKERLTKAGWTAVEADDPKSVVTLIPMAPLVTPEEISFCMAKALVGNEYAAKDFGQRLVKRIAEKDAKPAAAAPEPKV